MLRPDLKRIHNSAGSRVIAGLPSLLNVPVQPSEKSTGVTLAQSTAPSASEHLDAELSALREAAARWAALPIASKITLLRECARRVGEAASRWTEVAARAKGIAQTPLAGEEAISGPWAVLRALHGYVATLQQIERFGAPSVEDARLRERAQGQIVVDVFPDQVSDRVLLNGIRAEVWMDPSVTRATLRKTMGEWYQHSSPPGRVALVLGAGNIASIAPLDILYKLVAEGAVCMLKMNPVNDYLGPILEDALAPLAGEHFLEFAYGGAEVGQYLCHHPLVDEIHVTGSDRTHDAIVFGNGPDAAERKMRSEPLMTKPMTSELGNVSPTIVVPGPWTAADVQFQAENVVTQKLHNDGFNCIAAQVVVLPADWERTPAFIAAIENVMRRVSDRPAYYPGASTRAHALSSDRSAVERFGRNGDGFVARTIVRADASNAGDSAFTTEAFCSLLAIVTIPGETETYLRDATAFANERLQGTLGASLIAHPRTMRRYSLAFDRAVADLRYGCIGVNAWTGVGFLLSQVPWGAYPGHTLANIGSGIGAVHNTHLFSRSQKSVVYAPFAPFPRSLFGYGSTLLPKPPWFVTNRNQARIGEALCDFELRKSPALLVKIAFLAMTG
jgi:aldehyde dehydrogenase (NAD(P)+)